MLKRIYVDNFRCLVNFDLRLDELTLLLGLNGGGKSSVFDVLTRLRRFLAGEARVAEVFPPSSLTRWQSRALQRFELELAGPHGSYTYRLGIEHDGASRRMLVHGEELFLDGKPLFESQQGTVRLYNDHHSEGPCYPFDRTQSGLAAVLPGQDNTHLTDFLHRVGRFLIVALQTDRMSSDTAREDPLLSPDGSNFASWYRYLAQEYQDRIFELVSQLREIVPGFHGFRLAQAGSDNRVLQVAFSSEHGENTTRYYRFDELSDGQRALIALYTMLRAGPEAGYSIFIDEPDNFVALPEIQPWLMELRDACGESVPQAVLISHHPELIDYLGTDAVWLERSSPDGPTRILEELAVEDSGLSLSKHIARGWVP